MSTQLSSIDQANLEDTFRIRFEKNQEDQAVAISDLLDENHLYSYLNQINEFLQADQMMVVGSQLIKRLTNLLLVPQLYSLAVYNKQLDLFEGSSIVTAMKNKKWMPILKVGGHRAIQVKNRSERNAYLEENIHQISQFVKVIHQVAKVPTPLLWENVAVYVYKLYESKVKEAGLNLYEQKEAWNDFAYLLQLDPEIFQERFNFNPLQRFYTNKIEVEGKEQPVRVRRTCCFNYETSAGKYCKGCPKSDVNKEACLRTKRHVMEVEMIH